MEQSQLTFTEMSSMNKGRMLQFLATLWVISFLLHLAWEMWQVPFFEGMANAPHIGAVWICTKATFGDATLALTAYLLAAWSVGSIGWVKQLSVKPVVLYLVTGLLITVLFEYLATEVWGRWRYNELMPRLPLLGTGLLPLAQWFILPLVVLYFAKLSYFGLCYSVKVNSREISKKHARG